MSPTLKLFAVRVLSLVPAPVLRRVIPRRLARRLWPSDPRAVAEFRRRLYQRLADVLRPD